MNRDTNSRSRDGASSNDFIKHCLFLVVLLGIAGGILYSVFPWIVIEKLLTKVISPIGIVWFILGLASYFSLVKGARFAALMTFVGWTSLTLFGNENFSNEMMLSLEEPYEAIDPTNVEAFDYLIVLGGGTSVPGTDVPQLGFSGDRIAFAAELYHSNKVKKFICTGTNIEELANDNPIQVGEQSREVLADLGVPLNKIELSKGRNTREEIATLSKRFESNRPKRIGLLTSAWHLPRAERLAEAASLKIIPVPCDFRSNGQQIARSKAKILLSIVPDASSLRNSSSAFKEHLARWAGQ